MKAFGFTLPWQFYQQYDYRTIANLFPVIKSSEENAMKHGALEDAKAHIEQERIDYPNHPFFFNYDEGEIPEVRIVHRVNYDEIAEVII